MLCNPQNHNRLLPPQSLSPFHLLDDGGQQQQVLPRQTSRPTRGKKLQPSSLLLFPKLCRDVQGLFGTDIS